MKGLAFGVIIAGLLLVWYLSNPTLNEGFVSEFTDRTNEQRTAETSSSSYAQQTNHLIPTPPLLEPVPGMETPFRVNMFNSYQPV
jgi:hypothetical protein